MKDWKHKDCVLHVVYLFDKIIPADSYCKVTDSISNLTKVGFVEWYSDSKYTIIYIILSKLCSGEDLWNTE